MQLGERLLLRTTRKLTVTDFGLAVLEHAHHVVEDVAAATSLAQNRQIEPSGRLRVTMPSDMASIVLAPLLAEFVLKYPAITLEVDLSARFVDLIGENFDVAIRMGDLRDDASLAARRIAVFTGSLYAAPAYLARRGTPSEPEALMEHDALRILGRTGDPMPWILTRGEQRWEGIPPGRATANSPELLMRMALDGVGIAVINDHFALPYLQARRARPGAVRLADAVGQRVGGVSRPAPDAGANARVPRRARGKVHGARVSRHRGRRKEGQGTVATGGGLTFSSRPTTISRRSAQAPLTEASSPAAD